jgi:polyisoprenyl-phosphate glycosyltransferase
MTSYVRSAVASSDTPSNAAPRLSVVIPLFDEQDNLSVLIERLIRIMDGLGSTYEVFLIDDGSHDATWDRIKDASDRFPFLIGLRLARNFGHQAALLAGLTRSRGSAVICLDGDLQHPPELIPDMVAAWEGGAIVVETQRHYNSQTSWFKKFSSLWFYRVFSAISNVQIKPGCSDFRLLDRRALEQMLAFQQSDLFLRGVVSWLDFPSVTIEFEAANRHSGVSKYTLNRMLRFARGGILSFSNKPLHIGIGLGLITSALAFSYLVYAVIQFILGSTVPGWASIVGLFSLLFGVLFIILGIIGSYIGRIYFMLQHRPAYVIYEETVTPQSELDFQAA